MSNKQLAVLDDLLQELHIDSAVEKMIHDLIAERDALVECLRDMKKVTMVLGKGIGHIATPDNFFALWNDTEVQSTRLLREADRRNDE